MASNRTAVFLDRDTFPSYIQFRPPSCITRWIEYPFTTPDQVTRRIARAEVVVVNKTQLDAANLARAQALQLIALVATGSNNIDLDYCRQHAIAVANIRDYTSHSLAEHTFALILALKRRLISYQKRILAGEWQAHPHFVLFDEPIDDLHGAMLGIIGRGVLGRQVAGVARAFGMHVVFAERKNAPKCRAGYRPFAEVLARADILSLHCPHTPATDKMIGAAEIATMKKSALLINTARGGLVDEAALAHALQQGRIAGAGLDVLTMEPPTTANPLFKLAGAVNVIITPHTAWTSRQALTCAKDQTIANIEAFYNGAPKRLLT